MNCTMTSNNSKCWDLEVAATKASAEFPVVLDYQLATDLEMSLAGPGNGRMSPA
jgi:hypothetical protein